MSYTTQQDILDFVEDNNVKFVRFAFCDIFGFQKNIAVLTSDLPKALEDGVCFDGSAIAGFMHVEESDLVLRPDLSTMTILPWRTAEGRVMQFFCDVEKPDNTPFGGNCRGFLRDINRRFKQLGLRCNVGTECEFYLFENDDRGRPTRIPIDAGGYFDVAPLDAGENIRRDICLTMEQMGLAPQHSHHENGHGQNEIDFRYSDPLTAADHAITFHTVVRTVAAQNGLCANFSPKPLPDWDGNGMHINISAQCDEAAQPLPSVIAGILENIRDMTLFLNPCEESYRRLGHDKAPQYVTWSAENRSQLIRIPAAVGEYRRAELRSADPTANPYIAYALLIYAGMYGLEHELQLPPASDFNVYTAPAEVLEGLKKLPGSLYEAAALAGASAFINEHLPETVISAYRHR